MGRRLKAARVRGLRFHPSATRPFTHPQPTLRPAATCRLAYPHSTDPAGLLARETLR